MTSTSYPVPKPLWDALENVLMVKSKELIKDLALALHQSEKPLLDAFKAKKHAFHLVDFTDPLAEAPLCTALVCDHAVAHRCRKPPLLGKSVCPEHEWASSPSLEQKLQLQRIVTPEGETYFVDNLTNVYTVNFERIGMLQGDTLSLFDVNEEEEYA